MRKHWRIKGAREPQRNQFWKAVAEQNGFELLAGMVTSQAAGPLSPTHVGRPSALGQGTRLQAFRPDADSGGVLDSHMSDTGPGLAWPKFVDCCPRCCPKHDQ